MTPHSYQLLQLQRGDWNSLLIVTWAWTSGGWHVCPPHANLQQEHDDPRDDFEAERWPSAQVDIYTTTRPVDSTFKNRSFLTHVSQSSISEPCEAAPNVQMTFGAPIDNCVCCGHMLCAQDDQSQPTVGYNSSTRLSVSGKKAMYY
jgi:hypothetical protein